METKPFLINSLSATCILVGLIVAIYFSVTYFQADDGPSRVNFVDITDLGSIRFHHNGLVVLQGTLGVPSESPIEECQAPGRSTCLQWPDYATIVVNYEEEVNGISCARVNWQPVRYSDVPLQDCYELGDSHWYGSAEMSNQYWPIEKWNQSMAMYVSGRIGVDQNHYGNVQERYWLTSSGVAIRVSRSTPLHVSLNNNDDGQVCFQSTFEESFYPNPQDVPPQMDYTVCIGRNVYEVHRYMTQRYVQRPIGIPDERMMRSPVWSTWPRYRTYINESVVMNYANEILQNDFSKSQLEINDGYQTMYGDFQFDPERFPDPVGMMQILHNKGFRVTLWVTPFANIDSIAFRAGSEMGYWVMKKGETLPGLITWRNGVGAMLDVTNPDAVEWFIARLEKLRTKYAIDSFRFDAGEAIYLAKDFDTYELITNPCEYTTRYAEMASRLGPQIEVQAVYENQNLPIFIRMMDRRSTWGWDMGLKSVLTTALTLSVLGYPYILPDTIGGNLYYTDGFHTTQDKPERELYIRWLELASFFPSMQFSISPWQYDSEVIDIAHRWVTFHESIITPKMISLAKADTLTEGKPLIRPLWWIAPEDPDSLTIDTQFLIGDDMLVAPVLETAVRSRDVYLPPVEGFWEDTSSKEIYTGGRWICGLKVELDQVLYFMRV